jgi:hypothetical protein
MKTTSKTTAASTSSTSSTPCTSSKPCTTVEPGSILSETSFYVVKEWRGDKCIVTDDFGHEISLGNRYVQEICTSADIWTTEEPKTMTELAEIFSNSSRMAMTVCFTTKPTEKTKKDYEFEKQCKIDEILNASFSKTQSLVEDLIENPITRTIPGKTRIMKGRHYGHMDELGRIHFIDMEITKDPSKDYDTRSRQVDPRTIQWLIVNKVKYTLK